MSQVEPEPVDEAEPDETKALRFNYLKAGSFKEVPCDGTLGGETPQGRFWIGFYSERYPIPQVTETIGEVAGDYVVVPTGTRERTLKAREGIIRTLEVGAHMTIETARNLHVWLGRRLAALESGTPHD